MSEEEDWDDDWEFAGDDDAKLTIQAAVRYLLKRAAGTDRGHIVIQIIEIVREAAIGEQPTQSAPFDDEAPGG